VWRTNETYRKYIMAKDKNTRGFISASEEML
jgi:hypothetical protein